MNKIVKAYKESKGIYPIMMFTEKKQKKKTGVN